MIELVIVMVRPEVGCKEHTRLASWLGYSRAIELTIETGYG